MTTQRLHLRLFRHRSATPRRALALLLVLLATLAAAGFLLLATLREPPPPAPLLATIDRPLPSEGLTTVEGAAASLADYGGRPLVVNFWASWCEPCAREIPLLARARREHSADGLEVVGVLFHDDPADARAMLERLDAGYPTLVDADGATAVAFGLWGIPATYFVDAQGRIRGYRAGELRAETLQRGLELIRP